MYFIYKYNIEILFLSVFAYTRSTACLGIIHNKIHLIRPGCPWPIVALVQNRGLKHQSFPPLAYNADARSLNTGPD